MVSGDMATVRDVETFGQRVRKTREKKGIRQVDLAAKAGISWRHLIRIEQDAGGVTKPTTVARLVAALGVTEVDLTGEAPADDDDEESRMSPSLEDLLEALRPLGRLFEKTRVSA
jgi:transcriptional regulator with XRE-family HTH domain